MTDAELNLSQRAAAAPTNRVLAIMCAIAFAFFTLTNPYYMSTGIAINFALLTAPMIAALIGYALLTTRPAFSRWKWVELGLFSIITPLDFATVWVVSHASALIGWQPNAILFCNVATAISFATVAFVANFRAFAIWVCAVFLMDIFWVSRLDVSFAAASFHITSVITLIAIALYTNWTLDHRARQNLKISAELNAEKLKSEEMLYSILPEEVATRLKEGLAVADPFSDACVVFVDLVGSSQLARSLSPKHFIQTLDKVFSLADRCAHEHGIEKVKTIGDAYLAISGGRTGGDQQSVVRFAVDIVRQIRQLAADERLELDVRVGIHSGPVVGGVIGNVKATYDYWGDTMNIAARVESAAPVGGISVTKQVYYATRDQFSYAPPRLVTLKGIGELPIYDVQE